MARTLSKAVLSCVIAIAFASSLASCGGSDLLNPVTHTWALQSIINVPLPDTVPLSSPVIVITSGTATTTGNGNYSFTFSGTNNGVEGVVGTDNGQWTITSSTFIFRSAHGLPDYVGALNTGSIRVAIAGQVVHSTRQTIDMVFNEVQ